MRYGFDEEHRLLRRGLEELLDDLTSQKPRDEPVAESAGLDRLSWKRLGADGWLGLWTARVLSAPAVVHVQEAFGAQPLPAPVAFNAGFVAGLVAAGEETAARALLERGLSGELLVGGGTMSGPAGPQGRSTPRGLRWRNGRVDGVLEPAWFPLDADVLLVPVDAPDGATIAVLPRDREGLSVDGSPSLDGVPRFGRIRLDDVAVTERDLLSDPRPAQERLLDEATRRASLTYTALAVGGIEAVLRRTVRYVAEREQFGVPIGSFQALQHQLADVATSLENARALAYMAAWKLERAEPDAAVDVWAARRYSARAYVQACERAIQCHGGYGFTWEQGLQRWYRDALEARSQPVSAASQLRELEAALFST